MSVPEIIDYRVKNLLGRIYSYKNCGDELTPHKHSQQDEHITIVLSGSIKVVRDGNEEFYKSGEIVQFFENELHSITAMEHDTKTIHFYSYQDYWIKYMNETNSVIETTY